jgi:Uma2 family endonuclease
MSTLTGITIDEYEKLPAALAENHELVDGELVDVSGNTPKHNSARDFLVEIARPLVRRKRLGRILAEQEYDFAGNAHGPDVSFVSRDKVHLIDENKRVQRFVPDLAVEVASQNDRFEPLLKKVMRYLDCGTQEVWLVSIANRQVFVYRKAERRILGDRDVLSSQLIPGLKIQVRDLFDQA